MLPQLVNTGFQVLFHSPPGVLFTFPSQYYALSVTKEYSALGGGPPDFPQGFSCLVVLWIPPLPAVFMYGAFTLYGLTSQTVPLTDRLTYAVHNPSMHARWFGLLPFRSPLLWESMFLSLPPVTEMFQFTGFPAYGYGFTIRHLRVPQVGFPIQTSPDQRIFAPPRSFSQLITSFIGS